MVHVIDHLAQVTRQAANLAGAPDHRGHYGRGPDRVRLALPASRFPALADGIRVLSGRGQPLTLGGRCFGADGRDEGARSVAPDAEFGAQIVPRDGPAAGLRAVRLVELPHLHEKSGGQRQGYLRLSHCLRQGRRGDRADGVNLAEPPRPYLALADQQRRADRVDQGRPELPMGDRVGGVERQREQPAEPQHASRLAELLIALAVPGQKLHPGEQPDDAQVNCRTH